MVRWRRRQHAETAETTSAIDGNTATIGSSQTGRTVRVAQVRSTTGDETATPTEPLAAPPAETSPDTPADTPASTPTGTVLLDDGAEDAVPAAAPEAQPSGVVVAADGSRTLRVAQYRATDAETPPPLEVGEDGQLVTAPSETRTGAGLGLSILESAPVNLFVAAHPKQAFLTALGVALAAAVTGRPGREVAVVFFTVLVGQSILGWHNDLVDRGRDARHQTPRKPVAEGRLDTGTTWYALVIAVLVLIPLSISTGITAGALYLISLLIGVLANVMLRTGFLSWLPWAASYALLPYYLSYGGWGGDAVGDPPEPAIVVLAALLGLGVHFLRSIWGLVADDQDGWRTLPLRLGRRVGATRMLVLTGGYTVVVIALLAIIGSSVGLRA